MLNQSLAVNYFERLLLGYNFEELEKKILVEQKKCILEYGKLIKVFNEYTENIVKKLGITH